MDAASLERSVRSPGASSTWAPLFQRLDAKLPIVLGVFGASYLGFTAWACAGGAERARVGALVSVISQSRLHSAVFPPGGAFCLELIALWLHLVLRLLARLERPLDFARNAAQAAREGLPGAAMRALPLRSVRLWMWPVAYAHTHDTS